LNGLSTTARSVAAAALASLALATGPALGETVTVEMTGDLVFSPEAVTIESGDTVEWRNVSNVIHTATADPEKAADPGHVLLPEEAETFSSGIVPPGGTYSHTFAVPGRYRYVCLPHEGAGMIGEVIVE